MAQLGHQCVMLQTSISAASGHQVTVVQLQQVVVVVVEVVMVVACVVVAAEAVVVLALGAQVDRQIAGSGHLRLALVAFAFWLSKLVDNKDICKISSKYMLASMHW